MPPNLARHAPLIPGLHRLPIEPRLRRRILMLQPL